MAWVPSTTELKKIDELYVYTNFSQTFSYSSGVAGQDYAVTGITADKTNALMTVGVDTISGQYDAAPHGGSSITYLKKDGTYATATSFDDIQDSNEICSFSPPTIQTVTYTYTVTAEDTLGVGEPVSNTYTVVSTFNWDAGKEALLNAIAATRVGKINTPAYAE